MGSGVGRRLSEGGARVLTALEGRSEDSAARAAAAGMIPATDAEIAAADIVLSIVPPGEAEALAKRLSPVLSSAARKPLYVDCNAVNPKTVGRIADAVAATGCPFLDAAIIGGPPLEHHAGPVFYVSGQQAQRAEVLGRLGLAIRILEGPVGAASALKMSYAGITKGGTALGAAMLLAATGAGVDGALRRELADSQPQVLARFRRQMPDMYPKAYRWVAEMREIAGFLEAEGGVGVMFEGAARLYERLADGKDPAAIAALEAFLAEEKA
jgi:3-hydroxyisobutyrate dehydrogenase-like beta-hydroxyacid dehydrogenase